MSRLSDLNQAIAPVRPLRIVDVGANPLGRSPYERLLEDGCAEAVGFEPQAEAHARAEVMAHGKARIVRAAIGDGTARRLNVYRNDGMTSLFPLREASARYLGKFQGLGASARTETVETARLDDLDDVPSIDLLKVDAQGAEVMVLDGGRAKLARGVAVIAEMRFYQLYEGEPTLGDLDAALRAQGFVFHRFLQRSRAMLPSRQAHRLAQDARSQFIDGDVVYIRPVEDPSLWSDEALKRLALCAEGAFRSHDLALMAIDMLTDRGACHPKTAERYADALPRAARAA